MSGPGLDLLGAEEMAEIDDVVAVGRLSRHGPNDATLTATVRRLAEAGSITLATSGWHVHAHLEPALAARVLGQA